VFGVDLTQMPLLDLVQHLQPLPLSSRSTRSAPLPWSLPDTRKADISTLHKPDILILRRHNVECACPSGGYLLGFAAIDVATEYSRRCVMAHCTKCGAVVSDNATFCGACGAAQAAAGPASGASNPAPGASNPAPGAAQTGLAENVAGALCYVLGWITGLIFYFIDKRPSVRFHAAQSIVVFGGLHILSIVLGMFFGLSFLAGGLAGISIGLGIYRLIELAALVLWVLLMIKAYQGERFRVPFAADLAERIFGKSV
jgi:uncharacterized membrane protein/ribosomal protein L40E